MPCPPLFPFYGSKWRDAKRYPAPRHETVIEPFAGSAGYSLWWLPSRVRLLDRDPIIVGLWEYLIGASSREIQRLPDLEPGQSVDDIDIPQEARWLIGFWLNRGSAQPKKTQTAFSSRTDRSQLNWSERARERIAANLHLVRDWQVRLGSFETISRHREATFFIDPPYVDKGRYYRFSDIDYCQLAEWVRFIPGQVMVCEQDGADWLPFVSLASVKSTKGRSHEAIWIGGA